MMGVCEEPGVTEEADFYDPTAYIVLADGEGLCRASIHVHNDGEVGVEMPPGDDPEASETPNLNPEL